MHRICVYCGSNPGARPEYGAAARELGQRMGERGIGLVYGGSKAGTMGVIADSVLEHGGEVVGVIPGTLIEHEVAHDGLSELHAVNSMHERKALMEQLADGFIALPGGYGTHDELFEILAWSQLGIHRKPIGLLNIRGYYDALLAYLDHTVREGFVAQNNRELLLVDDDPGSMIEQLASWEAPPVKIWL